MTQSKSIEMVCQELVELVSDYLNQTLEAADRARFDAHLAICPPCTSYLAQMTTTLQLAGELGRQEATEEAKRDLVGVFRRWHQK